MSTNLNEAAALAALATCNSDDGDDPWFDHEKVFSAREALRAALAQATPKDCGNCWPIAAISVDAAGRCSGEKPGTDFAAALARLTIVAENTVSLLEHLTNSHQSATKHALCRRVLDQAREVLKA